MITASNTVKDILKYNTTVDTSAGARIEYNLNTMVPYIKSQSSGADHALSEAFKKLFPIDTIYKPFRPLLPGIKYYIYTDEASPGVQTDTPPGSFETIRLNLGSTGKPRLYYPGSDTYYKYWVGPKNENINISLEYFSDEENTNVKTIASNKIVARFETSHDIPSSWTIKATKSDGSKISLGNGTSLNSKGEAIVYYNGTSWSTEEPSYYSGTELFKSVSLEAVNSNNGKFLGVLELSPKWVIEIDNDVESFEINKETDDSSESLLPVGKLTANTLSININRYEQDLKNVVEYNKENEIDSSKIYLYKNAVIYPYVNIKNGSTDNKIYQGTFYMHSWDISEFGSAQILALDAAKILQETLAPEILVEDAPVTAAIKRLLDASGFSNYYIYVKKDEDDKVIDESITSVRYWWSDQEKTVWKCLQELCRDIQMNAFVDENNILNFYSRDYIYDNAKDTVWDFTSVPVSEESNTLLPNIVTLYSAEKSSANEVKILYQVPFTSNYEGGSSPLWQSEESYLGAGTLATELNENDDSYFTLNNTTIDTAQNQQVLYGFNGYVLLDNEIIEYDGVEYQYTPLEGGAPIEVDIKSQSDIYKYRSLSKAGYSSIYDPNSAYFKPTGKYKIKQRGALNTKKETHLASPSSFINEAGESNSNKFNRYTINIATAADKKEKPGTGTYKPPVNRTSNSIQKSFLSLNNLDKDKTTFDIAVRSFNSVNTSKSYFAFGTRMFFDSQFESPAQIGGISFFSNADGTESYHVIVRSTAAALMAKDIIIVKRYKVGSNYKVKVLKDSQTDHLNTLAGIYAGQSYSIDVLLKKESGKNTITVFINGYKITAQDVTFESGEIEVLPNSPTSNFGLLCGQGIVYFEYAYAKDIEEADYNDLVNQMSYIYNGVYSDDTLSLLYGNLVYNLGNTSSSSNGSLFEFGTVAREIKRARVRYTDKPAKPIRFSTANNRYATMLGYKVQPFSAEAFVLNNTSTYIPLDDANYSSFYVLGDSIQKSSPLEYYTYDVSNVSESDNKEPVIFQSDWIQFESDAKNLADWIKSTVLNKNRIIEMQVFGNPLVCPGDIISINYPLQSMSKSESEKYIITKVGHEYKEGFSTTISCRAI